MRLEHEISGIKNPVDQDAEDSEYQNGYYEGWDSALDAAIARLNAIVNGEYR
jgi:hypothetical protein